MYKLLLSSLLLLLFTTIAAQPQKQYKVIAYYSGDSTSLHQYHFEKITHLIYGFGHVKDGEFVITKTKDTATLLAFQKIKVQHPGLKTMIALGGWGGCEFCSQTFNDKTLTKKFAASVKKFLQQYQLDGIDLDWEYPSLPGYPGHQYLPEDRSNFTNLVKELRLALGNEKLISFAVGGMKKHLDSTIEWNNIKNLVNFVNVMSYDLVHGYSTVTGHHTALYSSNPNEESTEKAIKFFKKIKFPLKKVMSGAGFYSREFAVYNDANNGLYQPAKFLSFIDYKDAAKKHTPENGFVFSWDNKTKSPYWFNADKKIFVTGENRTSVKLKCDFIKKNKLGGIMFWELFTDAPENGLLDSINLK